MRVHIYIIKRVVREIPERKIAIPSLRIRLFNLHTVLLANPIKQMSERNVPPALFSVIYFSI